MHLKRLENPMRIAALALTAATAMSACAPSRMQPPSNYDLRQGIGATGDAVVSVAPDIIIVTFGIDTRDVNLLPAKQQNDAIHRAALAAIARQGIADKDIQTDQVSINQRFVPDESRRRQVLDGYTVRNMFAVTLSDPAKVDALISGVLAAGVTHLLNVDFQTSELKKYREQARDMAVKAAREKAEKMAGALGARLGAVVSIGEANQYAGARYYSSWTSEGWDNPRGNGAGMSQNVAQVSGGDATDGIALGKVAVRASVTVSFLLAH
jgi:uncharacterized protein YggE